MTVTGAQLLAALLRRGLSADAARLARLASTASQGDRTKVLGEARACCLR